MQQSFLSSYTAFAILLQFILTSVSQQFSWVYLVINLVLLVLQLITIIFVWKKKVQINHIQTLIAILLFIVNYEQEKFDQCQVLFILFETREIAFFNIGTYSSINNQDVTINNSCNLKIFAFLLSELYFIIRETLQNNMQLSQIIILISLMILRILGFMTMYWKPKEKEIKQKEFLQTQQLETERKLESDNKQIFVNIISEKNENDILKKIGEESALLKQETNKNIFIQSSFSENFLSQIMEISSDGIVLLEKSTGMDSREKDIKVSFLNENAKKLSIFQSPNDFLRVFNTYTDYKSLGYNQLQQVSLKSINNQFMVGMYSNSKAFCTKNKLPGTFIRVDPKSNFKIASRQRLRQRINSYQSYQYTFEQNQPEQASEDTIKKQMSLGEKIKDLWDRYSSNHQVFIGDKKFQQLAKYLVSLYVPVRTATVNSPNENENQKSKPDKTSLEVTIYGFCDFDQPIFIITLKDVTYQSWIDILDAQNKNKSKTISYVSHEFRTPLGCVIQMLEQYQETHNQKFIKSSLLNAKYLLSLSNDLLDLAQINVGKFQINNEKFHIGELIDGCLEMFQILAQEKNIKLQKTFTLNVPQIIMSDPRRIRQIVLNLLGNAFKFTLEGYITVCVSMITKYILNIQVRDTGIGIRDQDKQKLFTSFGKLEGDEIKNVQGVGLGLFISNQIAKLIGANAEIGLQVESEFQKGTTFSFNIFDMKESIAEQGLDDSQVVEVMRIDSEVSSNSSYQELNSSLQLEQQNSILEKMNHFRKISFQPKLIFQQSNKEDFIQPQCQCSDILVIDDNQFNIDMLKLLLQKFQLTKVDSIISGILAESMVKQKIQNNHCRTTECKVYRLIFIDVEMPIQDGLKTLTNIDSIYRQSDLRNITCLIMCTGYNQQREKIKAFGLGADEYLVKPIEKKELQEVLEKYYKH